MKISIVVPAFNEEKLISSSLQSINEARTGFEACQVASELIVCDNNSSDATPRLAEAEGAHVVFEPVNQIGRARNTGAAAASGDWLLFIDADSHPSPDLFRNLVQVLQSGRWIAAGVHVRLDTPQPWYWESWMHLWNRVSTLTRWAAGSFICCERRAFQSVGGFDLDLYAGEEVDLCQRLKKYGRRNGKRGIVIMKDHPLTTSARKTALYSRTELFATAFHSFLRGRSFLRRRDELKIWYDGRR